MLGATIVAFEQQLRSEDLRLRVKINFIRIFVGFLKQD